MTSSNNYFHHLSMKMFPFIACILLLLISLSVLFHFCYKIGKMKAFLCLSYWDHMHKNYFSNNFF